MLIIQWNQTAGKEQVCCYTFSNGLCSGVSITAVNVHGLSPYALDPAYLPKVHKNCILSSYVNNPCFLGTRVYISSRGKTKELE